MIPLHEIISISSLRKLLSPLLQSPKPTVAYSSSTKSHGHTSQDSFNPLPVASLSSPPTSSPSHQQPIRSCQASISSPSHCNVDHHAIVNYPAVLVPAKPAQRRHTDEESQSQPKHSAISRWLEEKPTGGMLEGGGKARSEREQGQETDVQVMMVWGTTAT